MLSLDNIDFIKKPSKQVIHDRWKFMVRKTKKDKDDLEKAMLMLFAKSQFSSEAAFHRWFRDQMKLFEEANND